MLKLELEAQEFYDEAANRFYEYDPVTLELEHSLVSLSKWESFYEKPFLSEEPKTREETRYYIGCMCLDEVPSDLTLSRITDTQIQEVDDYISKRHTATWFNEPKTSYRQTNKTVVTAEIIYYWMVSLQIPFECEHWNLNRLITLIRVINNKNQPQKKMSRNEAMAQARRLNEERKQQYNTRG